MKLTETARQIFLVIAILMGFVFVVLFSVFYVSDAIKNNNACGCVIPIPYMILILSSLGIFIGSLVFYILISQALKERKWSKKGIEKTLLFLHPEERKLIKYLSKGSFSQSQLEKGLGINKVKIHRMITKLTLKGVLIKEKKGKLTKITLLNELNDLFKEI